MANFSYFRRPAKLILYAFLLALTTTAALVFSLQYMLDGLSLEHAINSYAYVGTVYPIDRHYAPMEPIDQNVLDMIEGSSLTEAVDVRSTYAAYLMDANTVPDFMMTFDQVQQHYFVDATVAQEIKGAPQKGKVHYDTYVMRINRQWGSNSIVQASFTLMYTRAADEPKLESGQRYFLVGNYVILNNGVNSLYMQVTTPQALDITGRAEEYADNPLMLHPITQIPADMTLTDAEPHILSFMEENGILPVYETYATLSNAVTVRTTSDFTMLPYYLKGRIYLDSGRPIYTSDAGKKVCLISQGLSLRNRLRTGDRITLSVADGAYLMTPNTEDAGWESGWPMVGEQTQLTFAPAEEYEIIGIYHQLSRDTSDPLFSSVNDIFIPSSGERSSPVRPYAYSFRVTGPNQEAFVAQIRPALEELGYELKIIDSDWEDVEETFYAMLDRQRVMLCCAISAFVLSAALFSLLVFYNFRYEYGLMRLLGAYRKEAGIWMLGGYLVTALPASTIAVFSAWAVYVLWLRDAASAVMNVAMPDNGVCIAMLALFAFAQLLAGIAGLCVLTARSEKHLLRMIR